MREHANPAVLPAQEQLYLGIELGSTRVKAVLVGPDCRPLASGSAEWASSLKDGYWTYSLDAVWHTLQACYAALAAQVRATYGAQLQTLGGIGISAMMHGYLAFGEDGRLLVPFRTWQNTTTGPAADELSELLGCNIPQRWSAAHVYQAMLNGEAHVPHIARLNTLAGYVHEQLTGEFVLGIGDASGMFPVGRAGYDEEKLAAFDAAAGRFGVPWKLRDILPPVRLAGENAGRLTARGAALLDACGTLRPGIPLCPPEGDAGTGMVATNSIAPRTGNVSAGTSIFSMVVLEHALRGVYPQIDIVATPEGAPAAMVHCNNCTGEIDAWAAVFMEFAEKAGFAMRKAACYDLLYRVALEADGPPQACVAYNYLAGEPVAGMEQGRPLLVRMPGMRWGLAGFMRAQLLYRVRHAAPGHGHSDAARTCGNAVPHRARRLFQNAGRGAEGDGRRAGRSGGCAGHGGRGRPLGNGHSGRLYGKPGPFLRPAAVPDGCGVPGQRKACGNANRRRAERF